MLEVFGLRIDDKDMVNLYDRVYVTRDFHLTNIFFQRNQEDPEFVKPGSHDLLTGPAECTRTYLDIFTFNGSCALLTGPTNSVGALDNFTINVDLKHRNNDDSFPDYEVSNGVIDWIYYDEHLFNKPICKDIYGLYGSATLIYAVFGDATAVQVEVTLIKGDGENAAAAADVHGQLFVTNTVSGGNYRSVLFSKNSNEHVKVLFGHVIPFSRSEVVVTLGSNLIG